MFSSVVVLGEAWGRAFMVVVRRGKHSLNPLAVSIACPDGGQPSEDLQLRELLDAELLRHGKPGCSVTASTIFPYKQWLRMGKPSCRDITQWYLNLLPRIKARDSRNRKGTYFERMIASTGASYSKEIEAKNQLQHIIDLWHHSASSGRRPRRSALQISCFDPIKDHTGAALSGFPCLQQLSVSYDDEDHAGISVNAFYPTQYIFDRAYGNYLGLCNLGLFMAHEMGVTFRRLNCFVGHPELGTVGKREVEGLTNALRARMPSIE